MRYSYCTFRLDDIVPEMDWDRFNRMKSIFDKYKVKPLIGVVPDNQDPLLNVRGEHLDFWGTVRHLQEEGWMIAQHGYQHLYVTKDPGLLKVNQRSEFAGLPFAEQEIKIQKGREILEKNGILTDIFMAPSHSFDKNTLRALKESGFKYVSDGYTNYPYEYMGLKFIPCFHCLPKKRNGLVTVCIHTNDAKEKVFLKSEQFIKNNRDTVIDFREALGVPGKNRFWRITQVLIYWTQKLKNRFKKYIKVFVTRYLWKIPFIRNLWEKYVGPL